MIGDISMSSTGPSLSENDGLLKIAHLPFEVLLMIFRLLWKEDLKCIRLSSKNFRDLATGLLFDRAFVSPFNKDLEVFTEIVQRPHLSHGVKALIYSNELFDTELDESGYLGSIAHQLSACKIEKHHDKLLECVRQLRGVGAERHEVQPNSSLLRRGFKIYQDMAKEQEENLSNGKVVTCLCMGLERLVNVQTIKFGQGWMLKHISRVHAPLRQISRTQYWYYSPLARTWNPLILAPNNHSEGNFSAFPNIIHALALTGRTIKTLNCIDGIPPKVFNPKSYVTQSFLEYSTKALQGLKPFIFNVDMDADSGCVEILPKILQSMTGLEHLVIASKCGNISKVFGLKSHSWLHLSSLILSQFQCSASELLDLVLIQPTLKSLRLPYMKLLRGDWKDILDHLQNQLKLSSFKIDWPLVDAAGIDLWDKSTEGGRAFGKKLESYVLHGGLNPLANHIVGSLHTHAANDGNN